MNECALKRSQIRVVTYLPCDLGINVCIRESLVQAGRLPDPSFERVSWLQNHYVDHNGLEFLVLLHLPLRQWITGMCHHACIHMELGVESRTLPW